MTERKRITVTLSTTNYEKLEESAERYGITTNAFMAFVLGQWVDENFERERLLSQKVEEELAIPEDLFNNPQLMEMVKEILSSDQEFKDAARNKIGNK